MLPWIIGIGAVVLVVGIVIKVVRKNKTKTQS